MSATERSFLPALRFSWLSPFYDWVVRYSSGERRFKDMLVREARLGPDHVVLDVGCGTGTLALMLAAQAPRAVHALDADPQILEMGRQKSRAAGAAIHFQQGSAAALPYPDAHFDKVFCSLMFHHLPRATKAAAIGEIHRVLKPGGMLHFADWGKPRRRFARWRFFLVQLFDGFETTRDCLTDWVPERLAAQGFKVTPTGQVGTLFGDIVVLTASRPAAHS
ncbi:MAG: class I SAM-dependent methyltransferase [Pseudomonadota bacterium]